MTATVQGAGTARKPYEVGDRYYADVFDADGEFLVFDGRDGGGECAGPFPTLGAAWQAAEEMNAGLEASQ